ncbi:phage tail protein, partial [Haemophilus influenzae]|nr:phage tail protein [Haemophilus influenzae]
LQKAGFYPKAETQTQLYQAIVKIIDDNRKTASLTQKGETKLYTGYDSQSEDLALTPKTGYQLKQLIDSNTRALGNVIPNSKKSSAVNSNSADTVATSAAVKTANDNANGRVSKSGDTMTGDLSLKQGDYSGISFYNNDGYYLRLEGNPKAR